MYNKQRFSNTSIHQELKKFVFLRTFFNKPSKSYSYKKTSTVDVIRIISLQTSFLFDWADCPFRFLRFVFLKPFIISTLVFRYHRLFASSLLISDSYFASAMRKSPASSRSRNPNPINASLPAFSSFTRTTKYRVESTTASTKCPKFFYCA